MHTTEAWQNIPGYEGVYEVSDMGRVRSHTRVEHFVHPSTGNPWSRTRAGAILNPQLSGPKGKQYLQVTLTGRHQRKQRKVHHLVLEAYVGPRPDGMQGCHNNGDKLDNRLGNLRWDTSGGNNRDKRLHETDHQVRKTHCPRGHEYTAENVYDPTMTHRRCKQCARDRALNQGAPANPRTHCRKGHEFTPENTVLNGTGGARKCRTCMNDRRRAKYRKP